VFPGSHTNIKECEICQDEVWEPKKDSRVQQGHQGAQIKALYHLEMRRYADPVARLKNSFGS